MGIKSSCVSARWPLMAIVGCEQDRDCLAFHDDGDGLRAGTVSRSRSGLLRDGGLGVERPRTTQLCRPRGSPGCPPPCGTAHRAGLTGRRPRGTCSVLRCSRLRFALRDRLRGVGGSTVERLAHSGPLRDTDHESALLNSAGWLSLPTHGLMPALLSDSRACAQ